MRNRLFAFAKTKTQISFAVIAKLISAFVFATWIVQSLYFLKSEILSLRHLLWVYSPVYVRPGWKPKDKFSHDTAQVRLGRCHGADLRECSSGAQVIFFVLSAAAQIILFYKV